jgi:hypothetical protein
MEEEEQVDRNIVILEDEMVEGGAGPSGAR